VLKSRGKRESPAGGRGADKNTLPQKKKKKKNKPKDHKKEESHPPTKKHLNAADGPVTTGAQGIAQKVLASQNSLSRTGWGQQEKGCKKIRMRSSRSEWDLHE